MSVFSRVIGWYFRLPPAETHDVAVQRNLSVPMPDGVTLLADRYYPRAGGNRPLILIRSPYGRSGGLGLVFGRSFAERGFQVLIQSCRGTFGSGGTFDPFRNERTDGLATLAWMRQEPWYPGAFAMLGPSYLGFVQWAIAPEAGPELKALAPQITASEFRSQHYPGESFSLDTALTWIQLVATQEDPGRTSLAQQSRLNRMLEQARQHLPLGEADEVATGRPVAYYRDWLEHNQAGDSWWGAVDYSPGVAKVQAPAHLLGGWYDIFLPQLIEDYERLRRAGRSPYLTIGPWAHTSPGLLPESLRQAMVWFRAHLLGDRSGLRAAPVRVFVMGANQWREFEAWPPESFTPTGIRWHLQAGGGLSPAVPGPGQPDRYRYDPSDPTPAVGGTSLSAASGPKDNRALESRPDVLSYTSPPLKDNLEVIGPVSAELYTSSSLVHTDFFVRLCDVEPSGRSINVCDGLVRLGPGPAAVWPAGIRRVRIELWPTAYLFRRGHCLRVQVSSGAHPRFARNPGSGEPLATATRLVAADQTIYHDPDHPSAIILPIIEKSTGK
jgi:putative CocE/NonD family hydrolase